MIPRTLIVTAVTALFAANLAAQRAPARPLPWRFVTEQIIAPPEGSPGELGLITSMAIADDGTVYATQKEPATVLVFGPDGKYLRTIGAEGDGPGELRSGVVGVHGDLVMVQDWSARRFTIFRKNGTTVVTVPSLCCRQSPTLPVDSAGRAWIGGPPIRGVASFLRVDARGRVIDTIPVPPTRAMQTWVARGDMAVHEVAVPGRPYEIALVRRDGLLLMGRSDSMRFVLSRTGRDTVRVFAGPSQRIAVTAADKKLLIEGMIDAMPTETLQQSLRAVAKASDIPDLSNAWNGLMVDRANRTWVSLPAAKGGATQLGVFDQGGRYLGEVPFPDIGATRMLVMGTDRMAALEEDEDGLPRIRVMRLVVGK